MTTTTSRTTPRARASTPAANRQRNRRGEGGRLRQEIVDAAAALLESAGTEEAVTLRAVAREVGIAAPSIYAHFADRDAVLDAVRAQAFDELTAALDDAIAGETDPIRRLCELAGAYLAFAWDRPTRYGVLFETGRTAPDPAPGPAAASAGPRALDAAADDAGVAGPSELSPAGRRAIGTLIEAVADCPGRRAADALPEETATALWLALHGYAMLRPRLPAYPWPSRERLLEVLLVGVAGLDQRGVAEATRDQGWL